MRQGQTTTPGTTCPTLFDKCVGFSTSPTNHVTLKMQEVGPTISSSFPKKHQRINICRYNYKGSTFSPVISKPIELVRCGARTLDLPHSSWLSTIWTNQAMVLSLFLFLVTEAILCSYSHDIWCKAQHCCTISRDVCEECSGYAWTLTAKHWVLESCDTGRYCWPPVSRYS